MQTYTTPPMTGRQCDDFISWFDSAIGTETETHQDGDAFTVTCHELETGEPARYDSEAAAQAETTTLNDQLYRVAKNYHNNRAFICFSDTTKKA
mgnify:CR=1 FL=1